MVLFVFSAMIGSGWKLEKKVPRIVPKYRVTSRRTWPARVHSSSKTKSSPCAGRSSQLFDVRCTLAFWTRTLMCTLYTMRTPKRAKTNKIRPQFIALVLPPRLHEAPALCFICDYEGVEGFLFAVSVTHIPRTWKLCRCIEGGGVAHTALKWKTPEFVICIFSNIARWIAFT